MDTMIQIAIAIVIILICLFIWRRYSVLSSLDGVWHGHSKFLSDAGLVNYILIIQGSEGSLMIENENGIVFNDKIELDISGGFIGFNIYEYDLTITPIPTEDYENDITMRYDVTKGLITLQNDKLLAELYKNLEDTDLISD